MRYITDPKPERRKFTKEGLIGLLLGINLAWAFGLTGVLPYVIGISISIWITTNMLGSEKPYVKIIFWIFFVIIILIGWSMRVRYKEQKIRERVSPTTSLNVLVGVRLDGAT